MNLYLMQCYPVDWFGLVIQYGWNEDARQYKHNKVILDLRPKQYKNNAIAEK